jgi:hypothetical protein
MGELEIVNESDQGEYGAKGMKNIVLITDGQVTNEKLILKMIKQNKNKMLRVFTIGIGKSINRFFIKKMALTGAGTHLYLPLGEKKIAP